MELPNELRTTEQIQAWQAVQQCKHNMLHIRDTAEQTVNSAPPQFRQMIFMQLKGQMHHLAMVVMNIRATCKHTLKSWRDIDGMNIVDASQCVICEEKFTPPDPVSAAE